MPLVDDADVQIHLPVDKLKVEEIPDDLSNAKQDAERIIRGYLAGVIDSTEMALWQEPEDTPEIIRAIAGRLTAALIYRVRYSEHSLNDPEYAQNKYNEAMMFLQKIIDGSIDVPGIETTGSDATWFWPNDTTDPPKFTMADSY